MYQIVLHLAVKLDKLMNIAHWTDQDQLISSMEPLLQKGLVYTVALEWWYFDSYESLSFAALSSALVVALDLREGFHNGCWRTNRLYNANRVLSVLYSYFRDYCGTPALQVNTVRSKWCRRTQRDSVKKFLPRSMTALFVPLLKFQRAASNEESVRWARMKCDFSYIDSTFKALLTLRNHADKY